MAKCFRGEEKQYLVIFLLCLITLFASNYNTRLFVLVFGLVSWVLVYLFNRYSKNVDFILLRMLILSVPLSFTNVFGGPYSESILSWFNVFLLILVIRLLLILFLRHLTFSYLSLYALFFIGVSTVSVLIAYNAGSALKQFINIMMCTAGIIIGEGLGVRLDKSQINCLKLDYIHATKITAIGLLIQVVVINITKKIVGFYMFYGGYRHAYGFVFTDFSFLSLYLVSGAMMLVFAKDYYEGSNRKRVTDIVLLLISSIVTSARTGIVAFLIIFVFYCFYKFLSLLLKGSLKALYIAVLNIILIVGSYLSVLKTRGLAAFSDSGRGAINEQALKIFFENPLTGIGFGRENYKNLIGVIPHNIFYQALAQGGLIYTIPLVMLFLLVLLIAYRRKVDILPTLFCVLVGSLFVPNIFNSRFLLVIFLLIAIGSKYKDGLLGAKIQRFSKSEVKKEC